MLAELRLVDRLVVDAGVDLHRPQSAEARHQRALALDQPRVLPHRRRSLEVDTAGVGGNRHGEAAAQPEEVLDEGKARVAHHLHVAHHVDVGDGNQPLGAEEGAHRDLLFKHQTRGLAKAPQLGSAALAQ